MKIIRADHLGMCFGVRDAIALAREKARQEPLTILGELVHNERVLEGLKRDGVEMTSDPAQVKTRQAMITAHGASERAIAAAKAHGLELLEGTCPLVHHAHRAVRQLVKDGYFPVIIGKKEHVEVKGITEDLDEYAVVLNDDDIGDLPHKNKIGIASQTTQPIDRVEQLVAKIRERFPTSDIRFLDTVCQPTKQRQRAAQDLAKECEVVIVIGGEHSNNTRELVSTCRKFCQRVHHVRSANDVNPEWLKNTECVGITAGTSTPDDLIESVEERIRRFA